MRDLIYLSVGDTTVPFADYEGDTAAYCRGIHDAFRYLGIDSEVSEQIVDRLEHKPTRVQKTFLLRIAGFKQSDIADMVGVVQQTVSKDIRQQCRDVREILRFYVKPRTIEAMGDVEIPLSLRN